MVDVSNTKGDGDILGRDYTKRRRKREITRITKGSLVKFLSHNLLQLYNHLKIVKKYQYLYLQSHSFACTLHNFDSQPSDESNDKLS